MTRQSERSSGRRAKRGQRRAFLVGASCIGAGLAASAWRLGIGAEASRGAGSGPASLRLALIGQCLIRHDLRLRPWPDLLPISRRLRENDICFSDLELVIRGDRAGAPTRDPAGVHAADPVVIDCLRDMGVNLLATSNNHAFDLGTGGILDTMDALRSRGVPFAGTGETLAQASAPTFVSAAAGKVALVAAAAGMIRDGGAATDSRAGVHELRRGSNGGLDGSDVERMLESLRRARAQAQVVIAYLHNHLWEDAIERTADWQREFARRAIDAGATVFVAHGPPLLHGLEVYRGAPLFHGLGSFIFQTRKAEGAYGVANWESLLVECRFEGGKFVGAELVPLLLASEGENGPEDLETRGRPMFASGAAALATLDRVHDLSERLGQRFRVRGERGFLLP